MGFLEKVVKNVLHWLKICQGHQRTHVGPASIKSNSSSFTQRIQIKRLNLSQTIGPIVLAQGQASYGKFTKQAHYEHSHKFFTV